MNDRSWAVLRLVLGWAQMFTAVFAGVTLLLAGVGPLSLLAVVLACVLTTTSILLFGRRR